MFVVVTATSIALFSANSLNVGIASYVGIASPLVGGADIGPYLRFATPAIAYAIGLKASRAA
ncbi:hypothetical protein ACVDG5_025110 [Mesorhizobium sp. ORM6]